MRIARTTPKGHGRSWGAALALLLASAAPASAQDPEVRPGEPGTAAPADEAPTETPAPPPSPAWGDIEVIVIRGRQHEDLLRDTTISGTSFDTTELDDLRIQNIADLAEYTPNLDINTRSAASNPTLFIRGIGLKDYNANAAGAVAIYQDGINVNAPAIQLAQLFDVRSIEVLRGPQGAGSARNASAGAIRINSVEPDGQWGGSASFTYGNYNTMQAEGALSLPLYEDILSARFAFTANFRDGITDNECADWDPTAHTNLLTGQPFQVVSRELIEGTYATLNPSGSRVRVRLTPDGTARGDRYIYEPVFPPGTPEAEMVSFFERNSIQPGRRVDNRQIVGIQGDTFTLDAPVSVPDGIRVDGACILEPPGDVITPQGIDPLNDRGQPRLGDPFPPEQLNQFQARNGPSLESFQGLESRINNVDNWAGRGILRFQPFEEMDWLLNAHGGRNRSDSRHLQMVGADAYPEEGFFAALQNKFSEANAATLTGLEELVEVPGLSLSAEDRNPGGQTGGDPFSGWYDADGTEDLDTYGTNLRGTWELGPVTLTSLSGYEWYDRFIEDEGDANPAKIFPADYSDSAWQVSQELRARAEGERHRWEAGIFFIQEKLTATNLFPSTLNFRIEQNFEQKLWSLTPYAGGRYELTEELALESGVRYNIEHKDFTLVSSSTGELSGTTVPSIEEEQVDETWRAVTGDFTLSYTPFWSVLDAIQNDSLNLYAKYSRGMKAGHFNAGLTISGTAGTDARIDPVEPEFIHAVEVGGKSGWFENRLSLNVAGFRYWYKDLQVFDITNELGELPLQKLLNSDARVWGAEVELQARPLPGLSISSGFGFIDGHFVDFTVQKATVAPRGQGDLSTFDYDGNPLIAAPRYSVSAIVEYEIPLPGLGSLTPQYDFSWRSKTYLDPQALDPISQPAYWIHNARLAYRTPDGRIELAGWVENFLNEYYKEDVFDLTRSFNTILEVWGDPRTYGVTITYTW